MWMKTRPWPIVLLAVFHLLSPVVNELVIAWSQHLPLWKSLSLVYQNNSALRLFFGWGAVPIAGMALYMMKPWSYFVFLITEAAILIASFTAWRTPPSASAGPIVGACLMNMAVVTYFSHSRVRAAYFNARLRWWEAKPRYLLQAPARAHGDFGAISGRVENLSVGGLFFQTSRRLRNGDRVKISFLVFNQKYEAVGHVVYHLTGPNHGYGIQFTHLMPGKKKIKRLVKGLSLMGVNLRNQSEPWHVSFAHWVKRLVFTGSGFLPEFPANALERGPRAARKTPHLRLVQAERRKPKPRAIRTHVVVKRPKPKQVARTAKAKALARAA
jgi:hypothetical protein